jgi:radical SAM superfamily enzyme YgiQ (UPF0313 family)
MTKINEILAKEHNHEKILLVLMPYWPPLIPPLGIACLKSLLQEHGYSVKTVDANINESFRNIYNAYLDILKTIIPEHKKGNFYNTINDVLHDHMMAYLHYEDEGQYRELGKRIIREHFFVDIEDHVFIHLHETIKELYKELESYFLNLLEFEKPTVLGFSVYRDTLPASMFACKLAKDKYPGIKTVMGGAIFSQSLELESPNLKYFLKKADYVDQIIIGEGENLFLSFLRGELPGPGKVNSIKNINEKVLDISHAPIPDFSDFVLDYYPYIASYSSRSCPFKCSFCAETIYWGKYRKKSPQQVIAEFEQLYQKYKSQLFLMCDSLLNPVIMDISKELLKSGHLFYWDGYIRADKDVCSMENTILWRQAGFYRARLGVESGSQSVLDLMGKKITPQIISSSLLNLAAAGIKTTTYWIAGYPGETRQDFQQTLDLIEEMKDYIYEAECNPFTYFLTGQAGSSGFAEKNKIVPLYPEETKDMLIARTWIIDSLPTREETYERLSIFAEHCNKLGIPNPYSLQDIYKADERWQKLHDNAVPPVTAFKNKNIIMNECREVKKLSFIENTVNDDGNFGFSDI